MVAQQGRTSPIRTPTPPPSHTRGNHCSHTTQYPTGGPPLPFGRVWQALVGVSRPLWVYLLVIWPRTGTQMTPLATLLSPAPAPQANHPTPVTK